MARDSHSFIRDEGEVTTGMSFLAPAAEVLLEDFGVESEALFSKLFCAVPISEGG